MVDQVHQVRKMEEKRLISGVRRRDDEMGGGRLGESEKMHTHALRDSKHKREARASYRILDNWHVPRRTKDL